MSFVDLATLTLHRRHEMEGRISTFAGKCDQAINNIRKLKAQAWTFVNKLNCEPSELKERFLSCMQRLDEYIYLITEFNLSIDNLEKNESMELAPVQDNSYQNYPVMTPTNLMDVLSEATPTTSTACANMCPAEKEKLPIRRRPKREQLLIAFSSTSCSNESVGTNTVEKEAQCMADEVKELHITDPKAMINLPQQTILDTETVYEAAILSVDGSTFWIVVEQNGAFNLLQKMTEYYSQEQNRVPLHLHDLPNFTCCVYYDAEDTQAYFRAMFIRATEGSTNKEEVFLVDTGEQRPVTASCIQPLAPDFCVSPPFAYCCHLADVELSSDKTDELEEFLKQYLGKPFAMKIDDNSSESLGVYLYLDEENTLNELLVQEDLATALDKPARAETPHPIQGPPELRTSSEDYSGPEHDNPVEAVTGYNNRDELDICKHYAGGSEKTCFKGARCKKRHVIKHPDGWTLDRVSTPKCRAPPLPPPGTWHKVLVTYVCHFDRLYVMFQQQTAREELRSFGRVLPPTTLAALIRDMNSPATYAYYKPLQVAPAPGELVAAKYLDGQWYRARVIVATPPNQNVEVAPAPGELVAAKYLDGQWYRARVIVATPPNQNVEVMYIDYGNVLSVKENEIMQLETRFTVLPAQAVLCRLAGVSKLSEDSKTWVTAKQRLASLAQDRAMEAHVIARGYDELTVELFDQQGLNLAEQLAAGGAVAYTREYDLEDDSRRRFHLVQA